MGGWRGLVLAAILPLAVAGCSRVVHTRLEHEVTDHMVPEKPWIEMEGWTDRSGGWHELKGYARVTADSVLVYPGEPGSSAEGSTLKAFATIPRPDVALVGVRRFSLLKTTMLVALPVAVLIGAMAAEGTYSVGE
jgi:hypothetical protein